MQRRRKILLVLVAVVLAGAASTAWAINSVRYRLIIVAQKATGGVPDVSWVDLLYLLDPRSGVWLEPMADNPNPYATIQSPALTDLEVEQGRALFTARCAGCHAADGRGATGPALVGRRLEHGESDWALFRTIRTGIAQTPMVAQSLSRRETWQVVGHLKTLSKTSDQGIPGSSGSRRTGTLRDVSFERLRRADGTAGEDGWLTYSGSYNGHRHSSLAQINRSNVGTLAVSWLRVINLTGTDNVQSTPLVNGDMMFVPAPPQRVVAASTRTGEVLWEYSRTLPQDLGPGYGHITRGVALLGQLAYVGTVDAHLVALDAATGQVRWDVEVAPYREGYTITGAPLAIDGLIVTGVSGGDYGARGFIDAYDPATGERLWRFHAIPGPGEPGNETWPSDAWATGGAATWLTGGFDPERRLVLWGVGNPTPTYAGHVRAGDNLYSNSVVALDAKTGRLQWHFQFTPHDEYDFDAAQIPIRADLSQWGGSPDAILWGNRNGFFYLLDGATGAFRRGTPFVRQSWATGLDAAGRPIRAEGASPSERGTLIYPHQQGATSWWPPTFSPKTGLLYVPTLDGPMLAFRTAAPALQPGQQYNGGSVQYLSHEPPIPSVKALSAATGEVVWQYRPDRPDSRPTMGLMSTAGGLVFASDGTRLIALDDHTGKLLWQFDTSQLVRGAPITYLVDGRQHVAVAAGALLMTFALPDE